MEMARKKKMVSWTFDPELIDRLKAWIDRQEFPPNQNDVVARALKEFLDKRGKGQGDE